MKFCTKKFALSPCKAFHKNYAIYTYLNIDPPRMKSVPDISPQNNYLRTLFNFLYFRCFHEHLDMFTEIEKPDSQPLIETPFGGRFCGNNAPRERISLYQSLSLVFLTDRWKAGLLSINQINDIFQRTNVTETRFVGSYEFISDEKYTSIGVADGQAYGKDSLCTFTIYGNKYKGRNNKTGEMFSPTYPGVRLLCLTFKICTEKNVQYWIFIIRS